MWLMIFQRLDPKGTLCVAVREMVTGPVRAFVRRPEGVPAEPLSANTSAYSQARAKLPLEVAEKVSDWILESLQQQAKTLPGLERPMFLLDGSSILLAHSKANAEAWPPARNQHGNSHWPALRVVVAHDVISGLAVRPCGGPMYGAAAVGEQELTKPMIDRLPTEAIVLGDRNFGIFSMAWQSSSKKHPCLFRLTGKRAAKWSGGVEPPAGADQSIRWVPSREDRRNNPELPAMASVEDRLLAFRVRDASGKGQKPYFFTTLTLPADRILSLYGHRWNIETDLRSLKREVRMHMLDVKTPAMAERELVLGVAAYNLTRGAMNAAAAALNLNPRRLSFSQAQDTLNAFAPLLASASSDEELQQITRQMVGVFGQSKLPNRGQRRSPPRAVWPQPASFPKRRVNKKRCPVARRGIA